MRLRNTGQSLRSKRGLRQSDVCCDTRAFLNDSVSRTTMPPKIKQGESKATVQTPATSVSDSIPIPWSLHYVGEERLKQLGFTKLTELCRERGISPGDSSTSCIQKLNDWKADLKRQAPSPPPPVPPPIVVTAKSQAAGAGRRTPSPPLTAGGNAANTGAASAGAGRQSSSPPQTVPHVKATKSTAAPPVPAKASAAGRTDLTLVSWNIKFLSKNAEVWEKRKANIMETFHSLNPQFIAVQELVSGDGDKSDGGKQAAEEIKLALGAQWMHTYCDTREKGLGGKKNERILFMWQAGHPMFSSRTPILRTLAMTLVDSRRGAAADDVQRSYAALSLTQFIAVVTDGKICRQADLELEQKKILGGMKTEVGFTAASTFTFSRNPALLTFPADEGCGLPALHVLSFHLDTQKLENRAEVYVLQCLMVLAWQRGVHLVCMGDHNADEASNPHVWQAASPAAAAKAQPGAVADFEGLSQRIFPQHLFTNRFPYAAQPAHNDDMFAPKHWNLKSCGQGIIPSSVLQEGERLAVQGGDVKTKFTFLDQVWSDHRPLCASFEFEVRQATASKAAAAAEEQSAKDALSQAPTPIKRK